MPQQQKKDDRSLAEKLAQKAKDNPVAAGAAVTGIYTAGQGVSGLRRKAAVDQAIREAAGRAGLKDPKLDPNTGKKLGLTDPRRGQQTADFAKAIKSPVTRQEIRKAIDREVKVQAKPGRLQRIGNAIRNARASMGQGTPAPALGSPADIRTAARAVVTPQIKALKPTAEAADNMKKVRDLIVDIQRVGGRRSSILNTEINPTLTKAANFVKAGSGVAGKVVGYGALPVSLGMNYLAKKEASDFADAQQRRQPPAPAGAKSAVTAPAAAPKSAPAYKYEDVVAVNKLWNEAADEAEKLDIPANQLMSEHNRIFKERLKANPAYIAAFNEDKHFAKLRGK